MAEKNFVPNTRKQENLHVREFVPLLAPRELKAEMPITDPINKVVQGRRTCSYGIP